VDAIESILAEVVRLAVAAGLGLPATVGLLLAAAVILVFLRWAKDHPGASGPSDPPLTPGAPVQTGEGGAVVDGEGKPVTTGEPGGGSGGG
jgi:hypothetical protein